MKINRLILGEMQANCYIVSTKTTTIVVDPGDSAELILSYCEKTGNPLTAIHLTHGHIDHVMTAGEIQMITNCEVYIHKKDEFLLKRLIETAKHYFPYIQGVLEPEVTFFTADTIQIGDIAFKLLHVPGHTPGSVALYHEQEKVLISGDVIFEQGGIGRYDFAYSDKKILMQSIKNLLMLPKDVTVYPGHGETFIIEEFDKYTNL